MDNINSAVVILEMAKNVMDILNSFCHSVYLVILSNPANQRRA